MKKTELRLSSSCRKALCVHLGESAGTEVASFLQSLADRVAQLEQSKVSITPIAPRDSINLLPPLVEDLS